MIVLTCLETFNYFSTLRVRAKNYIHTLLKINTKNYNRHIVVYLNLLYFIVKIITTK